jgi:hypothetical protein
MRSLSFLVAFTGLICLSGCLIGSDLTQDPVSGPYYFWAFESTTQTKFVQDDTGNEMAHANPTVIVDSPVTKAGWDSNWVLVEQNKVNFYIFDLNKRKLYGPFNHQAFSTKRAAIGVPSTLDFTKDYTTEW